MKMLFTTNWLSSLFTEIMVVSQSNITICEVTIDSRKKSNHSLFIPLIGDRFDGHDYIKQAISNGAIAIFWNKNKELPPHLPQDFPVFLVHDTLMALQQLAKE